MQALETYLQDNIFVDYFNAFLSLPIFSTRFIYRPKHKKFQIDSTVEIKRIDKAILCAWIASERIPFFWKTDLFLDYLLCKLIITNMELDSRKEVSKMIDSSIVRKYIGHLIGMQNFRNYTNGTMGQYILNFWFDAEKFRRHTTAEQRRIAFRDIQHKYLKTGSAYELPDAVKLTVYGDGTAIMTKIVKNISIFSEDIFVVAQKTAVDRLCSYWVPKYVLHKCRELARTYDQRRASRAYIARYLKEQRLSVSHNLARDAVDRRKPSPVYESVVEADEYEQERNSFLETHRVSSAESCASGRKSCASEKKIRAKGRKTRAMSEHSYFPDIKRSGDPVGAAAKIPELKGTPLKLPPIIPTVESSRAATTENGVNIDEEDERVQQERRHSRLVDFTEFIKPRQPYASLSEGEMEVRKSHSKKKIELVSEAVSSSHCLMSEVDAFSPTSIARFTKPTYYEDIPKKPLNAHRRPSKTEVFMYDWPVEEKMFLASVTADRLAGGPFKEHLKGNMDTVSLGYLKFWEDVQTYSIMAQSTAVDMKFRQGRMITETYLRPECKYDINLEPALRQKLRVFLERGETGDLLMRTGTQMLRLLQEQWKEFQREDDERLEGVLEIQKWRETNTEDNVVAEENTEKKTYRMYRALDLALGLGQPEYQMPDIEDEDDVDDSDTSAQDEEEDEGSLRQRNLSIVNEEAVVALAMAKEDEESGYANNTRRNSHFYGKICRKPRRSSLFNVAAFKVRPPKPRKFADALSDPVQLLWLKRYLNEQNAITPLKFWMDVEKMKTQSKDSRARQTKTRAIVKTYFANIDDPGQHLCCKADIIKEIPRMDHVTPAMLVSAQSCVGRSLEETWFARYLATFPEDAEEDAFKLAPTNHLMVITKMAADGKTRVLWSVFIQCVTGFVRGVKKTDLRPAFMEFLANELTAPVDGKKMPNAQRRITNNRIVLADRLVNDLKFWLEAQRFKEICDGAESCARAGNYTVDDERLIQNKARTILECYIDSILPPKLQINIPQEIADDICQEWSSGCIERSLFYEAEVHVFCNLIFYWKKFLSRKMGKNEEKTSAKKERKKRAAKSSDRKEIFYLDDMPYRVVSLNPDDDPFPRLSYSLAYGLKLFL